MKEYIIIGAAIFIGVVVLTGAITWLDVMWGLFPLERW
jgi:hypothetical protein